MIKQTISIPFFLFFCLNSILQAATYHVSVTGSDISGTGSESTPWATITYALDNAVDDSIIEVHPGTYNGRIRIRGTFQSGVVVRSQVPYRAKLRNSDRVLTMYSDSRGVSGITLEGFDIAHSGSGADPLVIHIDGNGNNEVNNISLKNNILHDSYNNDILKINNGCTNILISGNIFYNQSGSDEHIDINSVSDVIVEDNIFFNDFEGSGRVNQQNTSSYIVIKDSNGTTDIFTGSKNITLRRNILLNWQGSSGTNFILLGEDGNDYYEAFDTLLENNLLIGNSAGVMRAAFGVKGCRDITFRNNTITGDLPSYAYAMRLNREGANLPNRNILFYNNAWSDQTGTMGAQTSSDSNDFSDTPPSDTTTFLLSNNLYWNGGVTIPEDSNELVNHTDDSSRIVADPLLPTPISIPLPRWVEVTGKFGDDSSTIHEAFLKLALFAVPGTGSTLVDNADSSATPTDDIFGNIRTSQADIGACELQNEPVVPVMSPVYLLLL